MSTSSVFLISDAPCYSSVVITVFMIGILDSFFFTVMLSVTNQGEISSRLVLACKVICIRYWHIDMFLQALQYWWHPSIVTLINWMLRWQKESQRGQIFKKRLIVPKFVDSQAASLFGKLKREELKQLVLCFLHEKYNLTLLLFVFLIVSLLLIKFELFPLVSSCFSPPLLFILLFNEFLLFTELDLDRLVAAKTWRLESLLFLAKNLVLLSIKFLLFIELNLDRRMSERLASSKEIVRLRLASRSRMSAGERWGGILKYLRNKKKRG